MGTDDIRLPASQQGGTASAALLVELVLAIGCVAGLIWALHENGLLTPRLLVSTGYAGAGVVVTLVVLRVIESALWLVFGLTFPGRRR